MLDCAENRLTALDLSHNTALEWLNCEDNCLITLDISPTVNLSQLSCDKQFFEAVNIYETGNEQYGWEVKFDDYMSPDKFAKISDVKGYNSTDNEITVLYSYGTAQFTERPLSVSYTYYTGNDTNYMNPVITFGSNVNVIFPVNPSPSPSPSPVESDDMSDIEFSRNGHLYRIFRQQKTQPEAQEYCESLGGHLVTINDPDERAFIEENLKKISDRYYFICEWEPAEAKFAPLNSEYLKWREDPTAYLEGKEFYGELPDPFDTSHLDDNPVESSGLHVADSIPAKYDPRTTGKVSEVRNQNPYGTCLVIRITRSYGVELSRSESRDNCAGFVGTSSGMVRLQGPETGICF